MNFKIFYWLGAVLIFIGVLIMHSHDISQADSHKSSTDENSGKIYRDLFIGTPIALLGIFLLIYSERKLVNK